MTRFNFDLSKNPYSNRRPLTKPEIDLMRTYLLAIEEYHYDSVENNYMTRMSDRVYEDMSDIGRQLEKDFQLSDKQVSYIEDVYTRYVLGERDYDRE